LLLVDDHPAVLSGLSTLLSHEFEVAGVAAGGYQAIEMARRVAPDAIVLDVNMPGLNGFQTLEALEQAGTRAPVVFLSMMGGDDFVSEAFRCGGRGYVLKSRAASDLPHAIEHVLLGRLFTPSLTSMAASVGGRGHAMLVQGEPRTALDGIAALFETELGRGDATCVIATADLRDGLTSRLSARRLDVLAPPEQSRYLVIDAAEALNRSMHNGRPDRDRLAGIATELEQFRRTAGNGRASRVTIYGNLVELLNAGGQPHAAVALEHLWSTVTEDLPFVTLCGYATSCFHDCAADVWAGACAAHSVVSHTNDI
jgi:DNA-binding NarL/FixJ family response regulator